jgi:hypothetical protein
MQIVILIVAWETSGFVAPGVHTRSGRPLALTQEFGGGTVPVGTDTIATAIVGVAPLVCADSDGVLGVAAAQLAANAATMNTLATRDREVRPFKPHPSHGEATTSAPQLSSRKSKPNSESAEAHEQT